MLQIGTILSLMSALMGGGAPTPDIMMEPPVIMIENEKTTPIDDPVEVPPQPQQNNPSVGYYDRKSWWFKRNKENVSRR